MSRCARRTDTRVIPAEATSLLTNSHGSSPHEIMKVHHANELCPFHDRQRHHAVSFHHSRSVGGQLIRLAGPWLSRHDVGYLHGEKIVLTLHEPGEIPGGDHTQKPAFTIDDGDGASLFGQQHYALPHG